MPLEPLLLFSQEDFNESLRTLEEDYEITERKFIIPASTAKHRLDSRGFNLAACRRLYDEFKSDTLYDFNVSSGEDKYIPNDLTFDEYLAGLKRAFEKYKSIYEIIDLNQIDDEALSIIFHEDFFHGSALSYFDDAESCVIMRALLEVIPQDTSIEFDLTDLVDSGYIDIKKIPNIYDHYMKVMLRKIGLDYQLYGYVIQDDPGVDQRIRRRIDSLSEDQFIEHILLPLLHKMGFERIRKVQFHGRNEFGSDVLPFRYNTPFGTKEYYAVQAKATPIHGTSSKDGNAGGLISQTTQALSVTFIDDLDNERKKLDKFVIACSKNITSDARRVIEDAIEGKRKLIFLDIENIIELVKKHKLLQYILFTELE